ncbi:hypothetical protein HGRIS_007802 [Hohenbuehelia grisea]|uniref:prephenate dehydratase n=1 Tax=Hohenbuehelia grisea TaxID=104357 RepID=A0ABR3J605_9AGAR
MTTDTTAKARSVSVAFLGPPGTYSHQAAHEVFGGTAAYLAQEKVVDVFSAVSVDATYGVIPQENSIFGHVVETYNRLRHADIGSTKLVCGEVTVSVQHCLLVRKGVELHQIKKILSHEQALGQCRGFKARHLPSAVEIKMSSTAAAAEALLLSEYADAAAICSKLCASLFEGVVVLREGIQDTNDNYTRFFVIGGSDAADLRVPSPSHFKALVCLQTGPSPSGTSEAPSRSDILPLLSALQLPTIRIDRRPPRSNAETPGRDMYFVELQEDGHSADKDDVLKEREWSAKVDAALKRVQAAGGEVTLLGTWSL